MLVKSWYRIHALRARNRQSQVARLPKKVPHPLNSPPRPAGGLTIQQSFAVIDRSYRSTKICTGALSPNQVRRVPAIVVLNSKTLMETATAKPRIFEIVLVYAFSRFFRDHIELEQHPIKRHHLIG
jgi:hypothetical protein